MSEYVNTQFPISDEIRFPSFPESTSKVLSGECLVASYKMLDEEGIQKHTSELQKEGLKWTKLSLGDEKYELVFFRKFSPEVMVAVNLRMRSLAIVPGPLSADEWMVLVRAYGYSDEKAAAFRDKVAKKSQEFCGEKIESTYPLLEFLTESQKRILSEELERLTTEQQDLVLNNLNLAAHIANKFVGTCPISREELDSLSHLGLVKAALKFDPSKGKKFSTFAYRVIFNEIANELYQVKRHSRISKAMRDAQTSKRVSDEYGHISTTHDPALRTLESVVADIRNYRGVK